MASALDSLVLMDAINVGIVSPAAFAVAFVATGAANVRLTADVGITANVIQITSAFVIKAGANQPWAASGTAALWIHWDALVQVKVHAPLANMVLALMASAIAGQDIMAQTVPRWTAIYWRTKVRLSGSMLPPHPPLLWML